MAFTNSPLVEFTRISPNKTSPRNHAIDMITIHTVGANATIESLGSVFSSTERKASSNYGVDSKSRIGMYCEKKDRSGHVVETVNSLVMGILQILSEQSI